MTPADFLTPTTASLPGPADVTATQSLLQVGETEASRTHCRARSPIPGFTTALTRFCTWIFFFHSFYVYPVSPHKSTAIAK